MRELLLLKGNPLAVTLADISATLPPGELATVMRLISRDPVLSEMERLDVIGNTLAGCPDPVVARQVYKLLAAEAGLQGPALRQKLREEAQRRGSRLRMDEDP